MKGAFLTLCVLLLYFSVFAGYTKRATAADDYDARLVPYGNTSGYLEIHLNGSWYGVHPNRFDNNAAKTACRDLGFDFLCRRESGKHYFQQDLKTLHQYPLCTGKEEAISNCEWKTTRQNDVPQGSKRLVLKCVNAEDDVLRLHGGVIPTEGTPQIRCDSGEDWRPLCGGTQWDARDCHAMCLQLGYKMCTRWESIQPSIWNGSDVIPADMLCSFSESHYLECDLVSKNFCDVDISGIAWMSCGVESDIQGYGNTILCGSEHTCANQCGRWQSDGRCNCDTACVIFNDCCFDFHQICNKEDKLFALDNNNMPFFHDSNLFDFAKCVKVGIHETKTEYFLVAECPVGYPQTGTVKQCEQYPLDQDMIARTPVCDNLGIIFKNVYCAICHGRKVADISPWDIAKFYEVGTIFIDDDVFGTHLPPGEEYEPIVNSQSGILRACHHNFSLSCPGELTSSKDAGKYLNAQAKCSLYYAPISLEVDGQGLTTFRNPDCFICADHPLEEPPVGPGYCHNTTNYRCHVNADLPCVPLRNSRVLLDLSFTSVHFNFSKLNLYAERKLTACLGEGMAYDPFLDICRVLECPAHYCYAASACVPCSVPINTPRIVRIDGDTTFEGIVRVLHEGKWYTASKELFDEKVSEVLCRELGLEYEPTSFMGRQNFSIEDEWYTLQIQCNGSESSLNDCNVTFPSQSIHETYATAAAITCTNKTQTILRLIDGILPSEGFVQVQFSEEGPWYFISGNTKHWDLRECEVLCRELNFTRGCASTSRLPTAPLSNGTRLAVTQHFFCASDDDRVYSCDNEPYSVDLVDSLVWVTCAIETEIENITVTICGSSQTCRNRCGSWHGACSCDLHCNTFGDCCFDFQEICGQVSEIIPELTVPFPTKFDFKRYSCSNVPEITFDILVIDTCQDDWVPDLIFSLCASSKIENNFAEIPVFDEQGVVYRNRFCALCNEVPSNNIFAYSSDFSAKVSDYNFASSSKNVLGLPRKCFQGTTDQCQSNSHSSSAMAYRFEMCPKLYLPIEELLFQSNKIRKYKNAFCKECLLDDPKGNPHGYCSLDRCSARLKREDCAFFQERLQGSILFNCQSGTPLCKNVGEVYDSITNKCHFFGCPEGFFYHVDACYEGSPPYNAPRKVLAKTAEDCYSCITSVTFDFVTHISDIKVCSLLSNISKGAPGPFSVDLVTDNMFDWLSLHNTLDSILLQTAAESRIFHGCGAAIIYLRLRLDDLINESCYNVTEVPHLLPGLCHLHGNFFGITYEYDTESEIFQRRNKFNIPCFNLLMTSLVCRPLPGKISGDNQPGPLAENEVYVPGHVIQGSHGSIHFSKIDSPGGLICTDQTAGGVLWLHATLSDCGLSSAIIFITVTMVTYHKFKILSSVSRNCRMNLLFSLLIACVAQMLHRKISLDDKLCLIVAGILHFSWLAHIHWLSIVFYKMMYKFKHQLKNSPFNFRESRNMLRCGMFAWGIPTVIVLLYVYLDVCDCIPGVVVRYYSNGHICLIGDNIAIVVTICLPTFTVISFGIGSLVYSVKALRGLKSTISHHQQATGAYVTLSTEIKDNILPMCDDNVKMEVNMQRVVRKRVIIRSGAFFKIARNVCVGLIQCCQALATHFVLLFTTAVLGTALFLWPSVADVGVTLEIVAALNGIIIPLWFLRRQKPTNLWLRFFFPGLFKE